MLIAKLAVPGVVGIPHIVAVNHTSAALTVPLAILAGDFNPVEFIVKTS